LIASAIKKLQRFGSTGQQPSPDKSNSDRALATRRQLMHPYHWTIYDKQTGEKLDSGTDWADNQKDLTDSVLKPSITTLYKSADEVKVSVRKVRN